MIRLVFVDPVPIAPFIAPVVVIVPLFHWIPELWSTVAAMSPWVSPTIYPKSPG